MRRCARPARKAGRFVRGICSGVCSRIRRHRHEHEVADQQVSKDAHVHFAVKGTKQLLLQLCHSKCACHVFVDIAQALCTMCCHLICAPVQHANVCMFMQGRVPLTCKPRPLRVCNRTARASDLIGARGMRSQAAVRLLFMELVALCLDSVLVQVLWRGLVLA